MKGMISEKAKEAFAVKRKLEDETFRYQEVKAFCVQTYDEMEAKAEAMNLDERFLGLTCLVVFLISLASPFLMVFLGLLAVEATWSIGLAAKFLLTPSLFMFSITEGFMVYISQLMFSIFSLWLIFDIMNGFEKGKRLEETPLRALYIYIAKKGVAWIIGLGGALIMGFLF